MIYAIPKTSDLLALRKKSCSTYCENTPAQIFCCRVAHLISFKKLRFEFLNDDFDF